MSASIQIGNQDTAGGKSFAMTKTIVGGACLIREEKINLPLAKAGVLSTRTDNDTGVFTLAGHGFSVGQRIDVYWDVGGVKGHRRGMKVSAVAGNDVTFGTGVGDVGAGDNLPAAASNITLARQMVFDLDFAGDNLLALLVYADVRSIITLTLEDDTEKTFWHLPDTAMSARWYKESGITNPVAGFAISKVYMSHSDTATQREVRIAALIL